MNQKIAAAAIGLAAFSAYLAVTSRNPVVVDKYPAEHKAGSAPQVESFQGENLKVFTDIAYSTDHRRNSLDIYAPAKTQNAPVLFFVHGGGWSEGDKNIYGHIGRHFSRNGFVTVVINHRLSPEVKHPAHAQDAAKAFVWVREHIAAYGGNPDRINLMGHSSGGHITALLASDPAYLGKHGHSPREVYRYVGISGVYNINLMVTLSGYGHVFEKRDHESASPVSFMPACPALLVYGEKDYISMPRQSTSFRDKIVRGGGSCDVFVAAGETHESIIVNVVKDDKPYAKRIMDFLVR